MNLLLGNCPVCGDELMVTRLHCRSCDTTIEGQFATGRMERLSPEQWKFVEAFIRNEGKLNRLEKELSLSYPTLRNRLQEIIRAMGYEVGQDEPTNLSDEERRRILDDLDAGRITAAKASELLRGS